MVSSYRIRETVDAMVWLGLGLLAMWSIGVLPGVLERQAHAHAWSFAVAWVFVSLLPAWLGASHVRRHLSLGSLKIFCSAALTFSLFMGFTLLGGEQIIERTLLVRWPEAFRTVWTTSQSDPLSPPISASKIVGTSWPWETALAALRWLYLGALATVPLAAFGTMLVAIRKRRVELEGTQSLLHLYG